MGNSSGCIFMPFFMGRAYAGIAFFVALAVVAQEFQHEPDHNLLRSEREKDTGVSAAQDDAWKIEDMPSKGVAERRHDIEGDGDTFLEKAKDFLFDVRRRKDAADAAAQKRE